MKLRPVIGVVLAASFVAAAAYAWQGPDSLSTPRPPSDPFHQIAADQGLIAVNLGGTDDYQQLGLIDAQRRVISVYHVDRESGQISFKSTRNCVWDLQLDEFNGSRPSPREIRDITSKPSFASPLDYGRE